MRMRQLSVEQITHLVCGVLEHWPWIVSKLPILSVGLVVTDLYFKSCILKQRVRIRLLVSGVGSGPNPNTETWVVLTPEGEERLGNGIHDDQRVGDHRLAPVSHVHDFCRARPPLTIKG